MSDQWDGVGGVCCLSSLLTDPGSMIGWWTQPDSGLKARADWPSLVSASPYSHRLSCVLALPLPTLPAGHTGRLLRALLGFSLLFLAAHVTFQICLHTVPRLDQLLEPNCESLGGLGGCLRAAGLGESQWSP